MCCKKDFPSIRIVTLSDNIQKTLSCPCVVFVDPSKQIYTSLYGCKPDCSCDCDLNMLPLCGCDCDHCLCVSKYGISPIERTLAMGCETHHRTFFKLAKEDY